MSLSSCPCMETVRSSRIGFGRSEPPHPCPGAPPIFARGFTQFLPASLARRVVVSVQWPFLSSRLLYRTSCGRTAKKRQRRFPTALRRQACFPFRPPTLEMSGWPRSGSTVPTVFDPHLTTPPLEYCTSRSASVEVSQNVHLPGIARPLYVSCLSARRMWPQATDTSS